MSVSPLLPCSRFIPYNLTLGGSLPNPALIGRVLRCPCKELLTESKDDPYYICWDSTANKSKCFSYTSTIFALCTIRQNWPKFSSHWELWVISFRYRRWLFSIFPTKELKGNGFKAVKISDMSKRSISWTGRRLNKSMSRLLASIFSVTIRTSCLSKLGIK